MRVVPTLNRKSAVRRKGCLASRAILSIVLLLGPALSGCFGVGFGVPFWPLTGPSAPSKEKITIQSVPTGASVRVKDAAGASLGSGVTPFVIEVGCMTTALITVSAPGYFSQTVTDKPLANQDDPMQALGFGTSQPGLEAACHTTDIVNVPLVQQRVGAEGPTATSLKVQGAATADSNGLGEKQKQEIEKLESE